MHPQPGRLSRDSLSGVANNVNYLFWLIGSQTPLGSCVFSVPGLHLRGAWQEHRTERVGPKGRGGGHRACGNLPRVRGLPETPTAVQAAFPWAGAMGDGATALPNLVAVAQQGWGGSYDPRALPRSVSIWPRNGVLVTGRWCSCRKSPGETCRTGTPPLGLWLLQRPLQEFGGSGAPLLFLWMGLKGLRKKGGPDLLAFQEAGRRAMAVLRGRRPSLSPGQNQGWSPRTPSRQVAPAVLP